MTTWLIFFFRKLGEASVVNPVTIEGTWQDVQFLYANRDRIAVSADRHRTEVYADRQRVEVRT